MASPGVYATVGRARQPFFAAIFFAERVWNLCLPRPRRFPTLRPIKPMNKSTRIKLFAMMVLELLIWGAWLPLINGYMQSHLHFDDWQRTWVNNAFAIASITAMFFSNQFADRNFAAEKFMAVSHLIGGVAILSIGFVPRFWPELGLPSVSLFWPLFVLMLIHSLFYVPTISITNSIAFTNLKDARNDF